MTYDLLVKDADRTRYRGILASTVDPCIHSRCSTALASDLLVLTTGGVSITLSG